MGSEYQRLTGYIIDYFPEPKHSKKDISEWAQDNVPAWKVMKKSEKEKVLQDWENFVFEAEIEPEITELVEGKSRGFIRRIRDFLGRLF